MKKARGYHLLLAPLGTPVYHVGTLMRPSYWGLPCGVLFFSCMLSRLAFLGQMCLLEQGLLESFVLTGAPELQCFSFGPVR